MERDLLEHILSGIEEPANLPFPYLKNITENFSEEREIGRGGFAKVYKGILPNRTVAVKRIMIDTHTIDDKLFYREVDSLLKVKHQNIVRFLGYCATTDQIAIKLEGVKEHIYAEIRERLLCFEYISNGSLLKHITDELRGLEWDIRYKLIKEICEAMRYMHMEKHIIHMDLKPANILLDDHMVAKVTDFGLSRLDELSKTTAVARCGSFGYMAPEYLYGGKMSVKSDIYSLGVIIMELVTGYKDLPHDNYNDVLRRWSHRWRKSGKEMALGYQQVTKCIEIGLRCKENDPFKRPFIDEIIRDIKNMEDTNGQISNATESTVGQICPYSEDDMLGIEPLELRFPFKINKQISCSFQLTNDTDAYIAFDVLTNSPLPYSIQPKKGIVPPQSKRIIDIALQSQEKAPRDVLRANEFTVRSAKVNGGRAFKDITTYTFTTKPGNMVDEVNLDVVFDTKDDPVDVLPNKLVPCTLNIINKRDKPVLVWLKRDMDQLDCFSDHLKIKVELGKKTSDQEFEEMNNHRDRIVNLSESREIQAKTTYTFFLTAEKRENLPEKTDVYLALEYNKLYKYTDPDTGSTFGSNRMRVILRAAYVPQGGMTCEEAIPLLFKIECVEVTDSPIKSLHAHPSEPWIITGHTQSHVCIWDYDMQNLVAKVKVPSNRGITSVTSVLFIARKQWFLVGTYDGFIHVYNYTIEMPKITSFGAGLNDRNVESLVVHPTHPYVMALSSSEIKVWDWDKGWECIQTFKQFYSVLSQIAFNPMDTNSIVAASGTGEVKVWNFGSPEPEYTLTGHSDQVNCLYFFKRDDQHFLITGSDDMTAKIWDMQKKTCVKTLKGFGCKVASVIFHPNLPLIIIGGGASFFLCSSTNFRLKRILYGSTFECYDKLFPSHFCGLACFVGSRRVVMTYGETLTVAEIHDEEAGGSEGRDDNSILMISQETQDIHVK